MGLGSIFLLLGFSVLVLLFIGRPFLESRNSSASTSDASNSGASVSDAHVLSATLAERDRILNTLYELDFDHDMGKIPEGDYQQQRTLLLEDGARTLKKLDELQQHSSGTDAELEIQSQLSARHERVEFETDGRQPSFASAAGGISNTTPVKTDPNDELEALLADRRRSRQGKAAGFCHNCGGPLAQSDQFCPKCGTKLA